LRTIRGVGAKEEKDGVVQQVRSAASEDGVEEVPEAESNDDTDTAAETEAKYAHVHQEIQDIVEEHTIAKDHADVGLWTLWRRYASIRRAMILGCGLWLASQLAGINTIMYYGASIVRRAGIDGGRTLDVWITVPLNSMQVFGVLVCYAIIDRFGRRPTLLLSMTLVAISLFLVALGFIIDSGILSIIAMCMYLFSFGLGLSTMPYTINAEIYPSEYRGICVAQATSVFWLANFVVSLTFLTLARYIGMEGVFFLFMAVVLIFGVFFYFKLPETTGLSLHEIQGLFSEKSPEERSSLPPAKDSELELYGSTTLHHRKNHEPGEDLPSLT